MTEQELRETNTRFIGEHTYNKPWEELSGSEKVDAVIIENQIHEAYKEANYVRLADDQSLVSHISYNLGLLQAECGRLFDNYPENFNLIMSKLDERLKKTGFRNVELDA